MKLALPLSLIVAASGMLACSSDEGDDRNNGGTGGTGTGTAGTSTGGTGTGGTGTGGTGTGGTGTGGTANAPNYTYGALYDITAEGNVNDTATGVNGGTFLTQSENMTVDAATAHRAGGLCFSGSTAVVPDANSYGTYWGAELGLNLKLRPVDGAAPPADAGADAGVELEPDPAGWPYGNVLGFSFKLVGNSTAADKGVPPSRIRFKGLPVGSDGMNDNYCSDLLATVDGGVVNVLFSQITFECWAPGNLGLEGDQINRVTVGPPRVVNAVANPKALQNISWQIASDVAATTPAPIVFDFCITELKPITGM